MDEIELVENRPYKRIDDRELRFDVYRSPQSDSSGNLPVVVFVHGEGPPEVIENSKDWGQYDGWGRIIAASGMMAVTFNRRSSPLLFALIRFCGRCGRPAGSCS